MDKRLVFASWYNKFHDEKITENELAVDGNGYVTDWKDRTFAVLSEQEIILLRKRKADEYCDELKAQIEYALRQCNMQGFCKYVQIDKNPVYEEFDQYDTVQLVGGKKFIMQEFMYNSKLYDIIQI